MLLVLCKPVSGWSLLGCCRVKFKIFSNVSHLHQISLFQNKLTGIPAATIGMRLRTAQHTEVWERQRVRQCQPSTSSTPAWGSQLELTGMAAGLNEVGASGESAYRAGFLTVDSATELHEGRETGLCPWGSTRGNVTNGANVAETCKGVRKKTGLSL